MVRADVEDASNSAETGHGGIRDLVEAFRIRVRQRRLDRVAQRVDLADVGDRARLRQVPHLLTPCLHDVSRSDAPLLRAQELELDGGDVGFRVQGGRGVEAPGFEP